MKKILLLTGLSLCLSGWITAQSVSPDAIACSGEFYSNAQGSVSWTLGEPMGETYMNTNNQLTQGFQQPWDFGTNVPVVSSTVSADVFPNPTVGLVNLQFGDASNGLYLIEICNLLGQQLSTTQVIATPSARTTISLADYANGIYFIIVSKADGTESSTFRINKNT